MSLRVVITGASSGIGRALALEYAQRGARLGLIARRADVLADLAQTVGVDCETYALDVRDAAALREAATAFERRFGGVDIVIANAGVSAGTLTTNSEDNAVFQEIVDINLVGLVNTFQPFMPMLLAAKRGTLVGIASVAGFRGIPGSGAYSASKAAAISYLESLRVELRASGIAVVTICPGYIATPMTAKNPFPMPFLMEPQRAAERMVSAIAAHKRYVVVPWQMGVIGSLLKMMPRALYDALFARAPRKPRRASLGG